MKVDIEIMETILKSEHACFLVEMESEIGNHITGMKKEVEVGMFFTDYQDSFQKELTLENVKNIYNKGLVCGYIFNKHKSMQFYDYIRHSVKIYPFSPDGELIATLLLETNAKSFYDYKKIIIDYEIKLMSNKIQGDL